MSQHMDHNEGKLPRYGIKHGQKFNMNNHSANDNHYQQ